MKWLALSLMTFDHANKYLFDSQLSGVFELGRLAMPLFGFVLSYNLARPGTLESGTYQRTMQRLAIYGVFASPFFIGLGGLGFGWWPLNIMFMLLVSTATLYLIEKGGPVRMLVAVALFSIGGAIVEYWWFALAFCMAAFWYCRTASKTSLAVWLVSAVSLYVVNRNLWALASLPIILAAPLVNVKIPRFRYVFYAYYPAHLAVLFIASTLIR